MVNAQLTYHFFHCALMEVAAAQLLRKWGLPEFKVLTTLNELNRHRIEADDLLEENSRKCVFFLLRYMADSTEDPKAVMSNSLCQPRGAKIV